MRTVKKSEIRRIDTRRHVDDQMLGLPRGDVEAHNKPVGIRSLKPRDACELK
jgi:hypothetical protein